MSAASRERVSSLPRTLAVAMWRRFSETTVSAGTQVGRLRVIGRFWLAATTEPESASAKPSPDAR